jgi:hypothetical protein
MSKKITIPIISAIILIITGFGFIYGYTYNVKGVITDVATEKPIENVEVKIGDFKATTDENGQYEIEDIKIYQREDIELEAPEDYIEADSIKIDYQNREITKDLKLEPTLKRMANLVTESAISYQQDYIWDFMHPDDKKYWKNKKEYSETYKKLKEARDRLGFGEKSFEIGDNIRALDDWQHERTNKKYKDVMEVPINYVLIEGGGERTQRELKYFKRVDGFYHYFYTQDKEELKKGLEIYNKFFQN